MRNWKPAFVFAVIVLLVGIFAIKVVRMVQAGQDAVRIQQNLEIFLRNSNASNMMTEGDNPALCDQVIKNFPLRDVHITSIKIQRHGSVANIDLVTSLS